VNDENIQQNDQVELLRGGTVVSSFAGAFGSSLRETRLTAILGYLIALKPKSFCDEFGITGTIESIWLEPHDEQGRPDIRIKSTHGLAVIEAKVSAADPFKQVRRYSAKWRILLTQYLPTPSQKKPGRVDYWTWRGVVDLIRRHTTEFARGKERFVSQDLIKHLEEHNMITSKEPVEIYARDINENESADLFLKGHLYCRDYMANSIMAEASYFAPYFGQAVSASHPGVQVGFSYIAEIVSRPKVETFADAKAVWREVNKEETSFSGEWDKLKIIQNWGWKSPRILLFLSAPRLAFNPPIKKKYIQKTQWSLQRTSYSFDEFYRAWSGEKIF
jgi:hypothetical protein